MSAYTLKHYFLVHTLQRLSDLKDGCLVLYPLKASAYRSVNLLDCQRYPTFANIHSVKVVAHSSVLKEMVIMVVFKSLLDENCSFGYH